MAIPPTSYIPTASSHRTMNSKCQYMRKEDYTPEEKRLHKALDVVSGEISRREDNPVSDAESRLRSANKRVASTQNGSLANARAKVDQMNALADALGMGGNKRKRRR